MKAAAFRCTSGSSRYQLARFIVDDPPPSLHDHYSHFLAVGSEEAPIEGLASVRHSNGTCSFPAFRFHEWLREVRREGISEKRLPCPPESGPSASDLRTSNDRIVSSKRDVRVFHKGNFPSSRSSHLSTSIISSPESLRTAPRPSDVSRAARPDAARGPSRRFGKQQPVRWECPLRGSTSQTVSPISTASRRHR